MRRSLIFRRVYESWTNTGGGFWKDLNDIPERGMSCRFKAFPITRATLQLEYYHLY
ncbi:MAG: hypothetical protein JXA54_16530 [Candidatus Heimdallarchaeota archaeon]|nr:hypothetical protein [Candidatus Heimdallarchaeota archaeon]